MINNKNNTLNADNSSNIINNPPKNSLGEKPASLKQLISYQFFHHRFLCYMIIAFIIITFSYTIVYDIITDNKNFPLFSTKNSPLNSVYISAQTENIIYNDTTELTINDVYLVNNNIIVELTSNNNSTDFIPQQFVLSRYESDTFTTPINYNIDNSNFACLLEDNKYNIKLMYPIGMNKSNYIYTLSIFDSSKKIISTTVLNPTSQPDSLEK